MPESNKTVAKQPVKHESYQTTLSGHY